MIAALLAIPLWLLYEACSGVLVLLGLFLVPVAIKLGSWWKSPINGQSIYSAPRFLWLWGNDEDGYKPAWYRLITPTWSEWTRMYAWGAIRNPVNNLRFIKCLHPPQRADRVHWIMRGNFIFVWQGILSRLIYRSEKYEFSIGWKYEPEAKDAEGWQAYGQGFGLRLKK